MVQAFAGYRITQTLREDDEFILQRALRDADGARVLLLAARHERPTALARIEREYALRAELDCAWAVRPLSGRPVGRHHERSDALAKKGAADDDQRDKHIGALQMDQHEQRCADQKLVGHRIQERTK